MSLLGSALAVEELDLSGFGLYSAKDPSVPDDDYFDSGYRSFEKILWARKSDEGVKYFIYEDKLVDWSKIE